MSTSKKDYVAIARIISDEQEGSHPAGVDVARAIALGLADHFGQDNPMFDRARFLAAAGVNDA